MVLPKEIMKLKIDHFNAYELITTNLRNQLRPTFSSTYESLCCVWNHFSELL